MTEIPSSSSLLRAAPDFRREGARWLALVESRAVQPLKWGMLVISVVYWMWSRGWDAPSTVAFGVFFLYGAVTAALQFLYWRDRVSSHEVRALAYFSYCMDLIFITVLIWLDLRESPVRLEPVAPGSDFYILYLLLILRGFALFRTPVENITMAALISVLFLVSLIWQEHGMNTMGSRAIVLRLAMIWAIMLLAVLIVDIINKQKEELLRMRERLVKAEGLAALGELAAGVAHEINNPIGIIKTYAQYLRKAVPKDDPHHDDFTTMEKEAERCQAIVQRMLDFSNPNVRGMEPFNVVQTIREVVAFVFHGKEGGASCEVVTDFAEKLPQVMGDEAQIKQALLNIIMNAKQVLSEQTENTGKKGEILVRARQVTGPRAPVEITVHDNGPGINPEDAEHAFEPFFTRRRGGTGLGLAITRRIIEAHDGSIEIWPAANGGTTVAITLPIAADDEPLPVSASGFYRATSEERRRVASEE